MKQREAFLTKTREGLLKRQAELLKEIEAISKEEISDKQVMDSGDEALSLSIEKLQSSLQETEIDELNQIEQALGRLKKGEFGRCIDCGELISQQRLEYSPYAARCIVCQEALESL